MVIFAQVIGKSDSKHVFLRGRRNYRLGRILAQAHAVLRANPFECPAIQFGAEGIVVPLSRPYKLECNTIKNRFWVNGIPEYFLRPVIAVDGVYLLVQNLILAEGSLHRRGCNSKFKAVACLLKQQLIRLTEIKSKWPVGIVLF